MAYSCPSKRHDFLVRRVPAPHLPGSLSPGCPPGEVPGGAADPAEGSWAAGSAVRVPPALTLALTSTPAAQTAKRLGPSPPGLRRPGPGQGGQPEAALAGSGPPRGVS